MESSSKSRGADQAMKTNGHDSAVAAAAAGAAKDKDDDKDDVIYAITNTTHEHLHVRDGTKQTSCWVGKKKNHSDTFSLIFVVVFVFVVAIVENDSMFLHTRLCSLTCRHTHTHTHTHIQNKKRWWR